MAAKRAMTGIAIALACAACATSHASDDLKPKAGGYSAVGDAPMNDDDDGGAPASFADYVANADSVAKGLQQAFYSCDSPENQKTFVPGSETLALEIGPDGKVTTVSPEERQGLNDDIELCLRRAAMGASFAPGKTWRFKVPLLFSRTTLKRTH